MCLCSNTSATWPLNPFFSSHPLYTPTSVPLVMFSDTCRALATLTYVVWHVAAGTGSRGIRSQGSQTVELGFEGKAVYSQFQSIFCIFLPSSVWIISSLISSLHFNSLYLIFVLSWIAMSTHTRFSLLALTSGLLQIPDCHLCLSYIWCSHSQETDTGSYIWRWPEFGAERICVTSQGCPRPSVTSEKAQSFQAQFPQLCNNDTMSISWESAKIPSLEPCWHPDSCVQWVPCDDCI